MNYQETEKKWGFVLPVEIEKINRIEADQGVMIDNQPTSLPWPPLSASEISSAKDVVADWSLPACHVPVMGDFHNLVCLDYTKSQTPEVVIINDDRNELIRYESLLKFLQSLITMPEKKIDTSGIIEEESWLDF